MSFHEPELMVYIQATLFDLLSEKRLLFIELLMRSDFR